MNTLEEIKTWSKKKRRQVYFELSRDKSLISETNSISFDDIVRVVSEVKNVGVEAMQGKGRQRNIVDARHFVYYFAKEHEKINMTLTRMGAKFNRDHATVVHGIRKIILLLDFDHDTQLEFAEIKRMLYELKKTKDIES